VNHNPMPDFNLLDMFPIQPQVEVPTKRNPPKPSQLYQVSTRDQRWLEKWAVRASTSYACILHRASSRDQAESDILRHYCRRRSRRTSRHRWAGTISLCRVHTTTRMHTSDRKGQTHICFS
jgi:hypothetical protein